MDSSKLTGVIPVLETPFDAAGRIDLDSFATVVRHVQESGATGAMFPGFASEFSKLDEAERRELSIALLEHTQGADFARIISIPDHSTTLAVAQALWAAGAGADALNILPPHFLSPSRQSVVSHIEAIASAVPDTALIVQLAPALTGSALTIADIVELAEVHPNLAVIKVESVPPGRIISQLDSSSTRLTSLVGYAGLHLPDAVARGAVGVQPGCSFVELYVQLWRLWGGGQSDAAESLHSRMLPYLSYWMTGVELIVQVEKTISLARGLIRSDLCRAPGYALDRWERAQVDRFLVEFSSELSVR